MSLFPYTTSLLFVWINLPHSMPLVNTSLQTQRQISIQDINGLFTRLIHIEQQKPKPTPKTSWTNKLAQCTLKWKGLWLIIQYCSLTGCEISNKGTWPCDWVWDSQQGYLEWHSYLSNFRKWLNAEDFLWKTFPSAEELSPLTLKAAYTSHFSVYSCHISFNGRSPIKHHVRRMV